MGENINFALLPYELGILHYGSDTPYTRGKNLGAGSLSHFGMDSTYANAVAILRCIFENEIRLVQQQITRPLEIDVAPNHRSNDAATSTAAPSGATQGEGQRAETRVS